MAKSLVLCLKRNLDKIKCGKQHFPVVSLITDMNFGEKLFPSRMWNSVASRNSRANSGTQKPIYRGGNAGGNY